MPPPYAFYDPASLPVKATDHALLIWTVIRSIHSAVISTLRWLFMQTLGGNEHQASSPPPLVPGWHSSPTTHHNVAIVALTNKLASIAWAVLAKNEIAHVLPSL